MNPFSPITQPGTFFFCKLAVNSGKAHQNYSEGSGAPVDQSILQPVQIQQAPRPVNSNIQMLPVSPPVLASAPGAAPVSVSVLNQLAAPVPTTAPSVSTTTTPVQQSAPQKISEPPKVPAMTLPVVPALPSKPTPSSTHTSFVYRAFDPLMPPPPGILVSQLRLVKL